MCGQYKKQLLEWVGFTVGQRQSVEVKYVYCECVCVNNS